MQYTITNGYNFIGNAETLNKAEEMCIEACKSSGIHFEKVRTIKSKGVVVLIFQYSTLYLEVFVIRKGTEILKED